MREGQVGLRRHHTCRVAVTTFSAVLTAQMLAGRPSARVVTPLASLLPSSQCVIVPTTKSFACTAAATSLW
jgi:hypothetical protein